MVAQECFPVETYLGEIPIRLSCCISDTAQDGDTDRKLK